MLVMRLAVCGLLAIVLAASGGSPALARYASIVIEADSGRILSAVNETDTKYPASLTKMMTLYLVFEALDAGKLRLEQRLPVSSHAAKQPPSRIGLKAGQSIRVGDAILALTTKSANDVAVVLAEAVGGTEAAFARQMTSKAREVGMAQTVFRNASGLPDAAQVSTARDLARLSQALIVHHPDHYHYFSARQFSWGNQSYTSHNRLLNDYHGVDGIKTGYIRASGFNVATSAVRSGRRLIAVVMGGESARSRDSHMADLLDTAFHRIQTASAETVWPDRPPILPVALGGARPDYRPDRQIATADAGSRSGGIPAAASTAIRAASGGEAAREVTGLGGDRSWAIQVGVFSNPDSAESIVRKAAHLLPDLPRDVLVGVTTKELPNGLPLYRARLTGVSREAALDACEKLVRSQIECWPVSAEEPSV